MGVDLVRLASGRAHRDGGFTLLEVLIATVIMAIIFMGLISAISGTFLSATMANRATEAQDTARQLLEEASELSYADMLLLHGNALIGTGGLAAKIQVYEVSTGLLLLEVEVCRPTTMPTLSALSAMTMAQFHALPSQAGSRVRFTTLTTGRFGAAAASSQ